MIFNSKLMPNLSIKMGKAMAAGGLSAKAVKTLEGVAELGIKNWERLVTRRILKNKY